MNAHPRGRAARVFLAVAIAAIAATAVASPFTAGTLVVERIGDGTIALSTSTFPIAIQEVSKAGGVVQTIALPTSGPNQQTDSGSSTSNGYLNTYFSGTVGYLSVPGLNFGTGMANANILNDKVNSTLDATGTVINRTLFPTGGASGTNPSPFTASNYRSSIATSGSTFYAAGTSSGTPNTGGVWYYNGSSFVQITTMTSPTVTNVRNVEIYGDQLYHSSSSSTFLGISSLGSGLPTTGTQAPTLRIDMGAGASPYGFVMFDTNADSTLDLAYIADDRTASGGAGGGLQKWTFSGTSWSKSWSLLVGPSGTSILQSGTGSGFAGLRGLAGTWDAVSGVSLFATTTETSNNRLISILDNGPTPSTYTLLAQAGTNYAFRGVDLSPMVSSPSTVPEMDPAGMGAVLALIAGAGGLVERRRSRSKAV